MENQKQITLSTVGKIAALLITAFFIYLTYINGPTGRVIVYVETVLIALAWGIGFWTNGYTQLPWRKSSD